MINTKNMAALSKLTLLTLACTTSIYTNAAILNDSSERRIQVRQGSSTTTGQVYISPANTSVIRGDSMQGLIAQKNRQYNFDAKLSIEENQRVITPSRSPRYNTAYNTQYGSPNNNHDSYYGDRSADFNTWLNSNRFRAQQVADYQRYLSSQLGTRNVPPMEQLLTTARSWDHCGYEPFQLPPRELWSNMVPTLSLYSQLKNPRRAAC